MSKHVILVTKRFEVTERARRVASIEAMAAQFELIARELAQQIALEEKRCGVNDPSSVLYSTLANATAQRRANLLKSAAELRTKLVVAKHEYEQSQAELDALQQTNQLLKKEEPTSPEALTT